MTERAVFEWTPATDTPHRIWVVERDGGLVRVAEKHTGCRWRETGRELIRGFHVEHDR